MKNDFLCKVKEMPWSMKIALGVLLLLLLSWCLVPCFEEFWFGSGKSRAEILTYIGGIVGGIFVMGHLFESSRMNNISQKANKDTRFKEAATLLDSQDSSSIMAGIFALRQIAEDSVSKDEKGYVYTIKEILCAVLRKGKDKKEARIVKIILNDLLNLSNIKIVEDDLYEADFANIKLKNPKFIGAELCKINFTNAKLLEADFTEAILLDVNFFGATLRKPVFTNAILRDSKFEGVTISFTISDSATFPEGDEYLSLFEETKNNLGMKEMTPEVLFEMVKRVNKVW